MTKELTIKAGQLSHKGLKETNEDCSGIYMPDDSFLVTKGIASVIADGVSSSEGARVASESCVLSFLNDYYSTPESWGVEKSAKKIFKAINHWLYGEGLRRFGSEYEMLTTFSAVIFKSTTAHIFHVGDTRISKIKDGLLETITKDHRRRVSGGRDVLGRAMGSDEKILIDYQRLPIEAGDIYVLTTDGVHEYLKSDEILSIVSKNVEEPEKACKELVSRAMENTSNDNLTAQVLVIKEVPELTEDEFFKKLLSLPFPPPLSAGMNFEGYKILRELKTSKKTEVFLALDEDSGEKVVIKAPSVNYLDDPEYINSFLNEEWVGKRIKSGNVLKILETKKRKRYLYYLTEYIEGKSLGQWIKDNPKPSIDEVRAIISQAVIGLHAFHRKAMVHQDVKPENIMLDDFGTVKIIDFGSTKVEGLDEIKTPLEEVTGPRGTINYLAPEYFKNQGGSNQSDLYALAVVTYEMLSGGKYPYKERTEWKEPKEYKYKSLKYVRDDIPLWIDGAIKKALSTKVNRRHVELSEFLYELHHPNKNYLTIKHEPLLEKDPVKFWKTSALILFALALIEFFILVTK